MTPRTRCVMLEVQWAHPPPPVRRVVLPPGHVIRVGRTELADFRVPGDRQMSGVHFELSWDGERCRARDRGSSSGLWLAGERVQEGEVKSGGWIRAGNTIFRVYFEEAAERPLTTDSPEQAARKEAALGALRAAPEPFYALLDAARHRRVLELLRGSTEEYQSLYDGVMGEALGDVAPYLVRLSKKGALLERLVREGWGESWGVYSMSSRPFVEVRRQFQAISRVDLEGVHTQRVYFRFYDPRVLRAFLPTCKARQKSEMFRAARCFWVEGERGEVLSFRR